MLQDFDASEERSCHIQAVIPTCNMGSRVGCKFIYQTAVSIQFTSQPDEIGVGVKCDVPGPHNHQSSQRATRASLAGDSLTQCLASTSSPRVNENRLRNTAAQPRRPHTTTSTNPFPFPSNLFSTDKMGGVTVKDVEAQKFITSYAAFLKRQGKLPM